ncbi:beta-xylosidase [Allokutzneria multivorans]|uniref:Beta-xylosidase n=1 Tax=Allokutzneria multivorans TaxID=1142134 RepID=A0ABP7S0J0_9PSEU
MGLRRPRNLLAALLCVLVLAASILSACTTTPPPEPPPPAMTGPVAVPPNRGGAGGTADLLPAILGIDRPRQSAGVVAAGGPQAPYNYGPTLLQENGRVRMWWCSQLIGAGPPGDDIVHGDAATPAGPFEAVGAVFSGSGGGFDAMHTCDPSVIKVSGTYYLYYTGAPSDHTHDNSIGVAASDDGVNWRRLAAGGPIVRASGEVRRANTYGAGQPAVFHLDGWFHLMFTDTTAAGAGPNGAGQFVLRAKDPLFAEQVQALTRDGFVPVGSAQASRTRSVVDAFSADWMWVPALNAVAIAHETGEGTTLTFWDRAFARHPYRPVHIPGPWQEGPGLVRTAEGHATISAEDPCGRASFDVVRATREPSAPTDLQHFGIDVRGFDGCADTTRARKVLEGFALPAPDRTIDVVIGGNRVRVERKSVAERLAVRLLPTSVPALLRLPVLARLRPGAPAIRAPGRPFAFLLDDGRLWRLGSEPAALANESPIVDVPVDRWDAYRAGSTLGG